MTTRKMPATICVWQDSDGEESYLIATSDENDIPDDVRDVTQYHIGAAFKVSRSIVMIRQNRMPRK